MLTLHDAKGAMLRSRVYALLTGEDQSWQSRLLSYYFDALVVVSIVGLCLQTVPEWRHHLVAIDFGLETAVAAQFLMRLLLKLWSCPSAKDYLRSWDFWLDVISIVPWAVELTVLLTGYTGRWYAHFRLLRMLRFGRVLCCGWAKPGDMGLFLRALRRSRPAFQLLAGVGLTGFLCFAWAIWTAETHDCHLRGHRLVRKGADSEPCALQNVFEALWMCLCTLATVGYGDYVPRTAIGMLLMSVLMMAGYVFLALPVAIFGANLTELYVEKRLRRRREKLQEIEATDTDMQPQENEFTIRSHYSRQY